MGSPDRLPIIQYWHDGTPPDDVEGLIGSFSQHNPYLSHRVFSEATAEELIEHHFTPRHRDAFRACAVPAMQADYFRYCAILVLGGIYCDVDELCVADLRPLMPGRNEAVLFELPQFGLIVNGVFAFGGPGHPFLEVALDIATAHIENRLSESVFHVTGPLIFTWIYWAATLGSSDAVIDHAEDQVARLSRAGLVHTGRWKPGALAAILRCYSDAIGDYARVANVLDGVRVLPFNDRLGFVRPPDSSPRYKDGDLHYQNWASSRSIFRSAVSG